MTSGTATDYGVLRLHRRATVLVLPIIVLWASVWGIAQYWDAVESWRSWALTALGVVVVFVLATWLAWRTTVYVVDDHEAQSSQGILRRVSRRVSLASVTSVEVSQSLWQRIWGAGDVRLRVDDTAALVLRGIPDPKAVQLVISEVAAQARADEIRRRAASYETMPVDVDDVPN